MVPFPDACHVLDAAPAPVMATQADVIEGSRACPVMGAVRAAFPRSAAMSEDELAVLRGDIDRALADQPRACVVALGHELSTATDCGIVFDAVVIRVLNNGSIDPALAAGALLRPSSCQWKAVSALREAVRAEPSLVRAVVKLTESHDVDVRNSAWMTLGTLSRVANKNGQTDLNACTESALVSGLSALPPEGRAPLLQAAGNAGCERCRPIIDAHVRGADPDLRRHGVASLRFLSERRDVDAMCGALRNDAVGTVRATAAFAIRHGTTFTEERLKCLFEAATEDAEKRVAADAVASIAELATHEPLGVGTLVHVVRHARHPTARNAATEALRGFATDEAIRAQITAPP